MLSKITNDKLKLSIILMVKRIIKHDF